MLILRYSNFLLTLNSLQAQYDTELIKLRSNVQDAESERDALNVKMNERISELEAEITRVTQQSETEKTDLKAQVRSINTIYDAFTLIISSLSSPKICS